MDYMSTVPTLVLIAQVVLPLERRQTDKQTKRQTNIRDWTPAAIQPARVIIIIIIIQVSIFIVLSSWPKTIARVHPIRARNAGSVPPILNLSVAFTGQHGGMVPQNFGLSPVAPTFHALGL